MLISRKFAVILESTVLVISIPIILTFPWQSKTITWTVFQVCCWVVEVTWCCFLGWWGFSIASQTKFQTFLRCASCFGLGSVWSTQLRIFIFPQSCSVLYTLTVLGTGWEFVVASQTLARKYTGFSGSSFFDMVTKMVPWTTKKFH